MTPLDVTDHLSNVTYHLESRFPVNVTLSRHSYLVRDCVTWTNVIECFQCDGHIILI
jgi:hypothetical protein